MSEETPNIGTVKFGQRELDPDAEADYVSRIKKAKERLDVDSLKGSTPVGHVPRPKMPDLARAREVEPPMDLSYDLGSKRGVSPRPPGSQPISDSTAKSLQDMAVATKAQQESDANKAEAPETTATEDKGTEELLALLESSAGPRNEAERIYNNTQRRKKIEERCTPMNVDDLMEKTYVTQRVPVIPGKFEPTFRSPTGDDELYAKQFMASENGNEAYLTSKYTFCLLAMSVVSLVPGKEYPDHRDSNGQVKEDLFKKKLAALQKLSIYVLADLSVQYLWFDIRCRKLVTQDSLGNG